MTDRAVKGPIELLCKEIGFQFDPRLETPELLVGFVSVLVSHIADRAEMETELAKRLPGSTGPTDDFREILRLTTEMLSSNDLDTLIPKACRVHDLINEVAPDDIYPCDHGIDMLSSCASAIRFGLEKPCRSRHAAEAAGHVWKQVYGLKRFDRLTPNWQHDWTRQQFQAAIIQRIAP